MIDRPSVNYHRLHVHDPRCGKTSRIEILTVSEFGERVESVSKMQKVIDNLAPDDNGKFLDYEDGRVIPW